MVDSTAASWLPTRGRFPVSAGPSLIRAVKIRKNEPPPNSRHERHYHTLRCSFKPATVDITKPGVIEFRKTEETRNVKVERPSTQTNEEMHLFAGRDTPAKDLDCILIYDEETNSFTLEKLDSVMNVTYDKRIPREQRPAGSPMPSSGPSTSASSPDSAPLAQTTAKRSTQARTAADQLEAELEGTSESKTRSPPKPADELAKKPVQQKSDLAKARKLAFTKKPKKPIPPPPRREEGEESEGEIIENPRIPEPARVPPLKPPTPSQPAPQKQNAPPQRKTLAQAAAERRAQGNAPPTPTHQLPAKPPAPSPSPQKVTKVSVSKKREAPEAPSSKPSPPKRAKASPPLIPPPTRAPAPPKKEKEKPKEKVELAFPGGPGLTLPGAPLAATPKPMSLAFPGSSSIAPALPPATAALEATGEDSEEEDWDDVLDEVLQTVDTSSVPTPSASTLPPQPRAITMEEIVPEPTVHHDNGEEEEEEEIDADMFAQELNQHLGGDEDEDFPPDPVSPVADSQPLTMEQLMSAQGGEGDSMWGDDYDSSSSEDSDDD